MKGLEKSRELYETLGKPMLHELFPDFENRIAAGLAGHGSECFGYDDEVSLDHDYEPGFCLWITGEDDVLFGPRLNRAYNSLPIPRAKQRSLGGGSSTGVRIIEDFYRPYIGSNSPPEELLHWLSLPSWALAEATNGQVFRDDLGEFSHIREILLHGMPEDVRKKHLAAKCLAAAQAGQYNYARCLEHGEDGAAVLALGKFVTAAAEAIYLLNRRHAPYYKWLLRGLRGLPLLSSCAPGLELILTGDNDKSGQNLKAGLIEDISAQIIKELRAQDLTHGTWDFLEPHAYEIAQRIKSPELKTLPLME